MKIRNKYTGEIVEYTEIGFYKTKSDGNEVFIPTCGSLVELNKDWEDYDPKETTFDEKIRRGIRAWWNMQDNPFKSASVICYEKKDQDGFYHWRIFGYIRDGKERVSTDLCFRTKKLYSYEKFHDYTKEELCGEDEE